MEAVETGFQWRQERQNFRQNKGSRGQKAAVTMTFSSGQRMNGEDITFILNLCCPAAAAAAKSLQSCLTLCDPIDGGPPGPPVPGILQARTLEWVAISFSNAWKGKGKVKSLSCIWLLATPWTAAHQAPPSMGFSRQEYWSGLPFPSPMQESEEWNWSLSVVSNF